MISGQISDLTSELDGDGRANCSQGGDCAGSVGSPPFAPEGATKGTCQGAELARFHGSKGIDEVYPVPHGVLVVAVVGSDGTPAERDKS